MPGQWCMALTIFGVALNVDNADKYIPLLHSQYATELKEFGEEFFFDEISVGLLLKGGYKLWQVNNEENSKMYIVLKSIYIDPECNSHSYTSSENIVVEPPTSLEVATFKSFLIKHDISEPYKQYLLFDRRLFG